MAINFYECFILSFFSFFSSLTDISFPIDLLYYMVGCYYHHSCCPCYVYVHIFDSNFLSFYLFFLFFFLIYTRFLFHSMRVSEWEKEKKGIVDIYVVFGGFLSFVLWVIEIFRFFFLYFIMFCKEKYFSDFFSALQLTYINICM